MFVHFQIQPNGTKVCEDNFAVPDFCVTRGHRISPNSNVFGTIHQRGVASFDDRERKLLRRA